MIICHVITAFGFGGAEKLLVDLVNVQCEKHEVHIVYLKGEPILEKLLKDSVNLHKIELSVTVVNQLRRFIISLGPDVVHTHVGHADFIALWACRGLRVKRVTTMHNIRYKSNALDYLIFGIYRLLFLTVAKDTKVVAISSVVKSHVENMLGVKKSNTSLIYNSIPTISISKTKHELRSELNIPKDCFCVLFVGRLEVPKSVDTLLLATRSIKSAIPNLFVLIVGDGSLKNKLFILAHELGISETVKFAGPSNEVEKYFCAADILVLPSIFEGFGMVVIEAFRASLPVIATDIEGPRELIIHETNGLLFKPLDHNALAGAIKHLNECDELRISLGRRGYLSYQGQYDIAHYAEQIEALYLA